MTTNAHAPGLEFPGLTDPETAILALAIGCEGEALEVSSMVTVFDFEPGLNRSIYEGVCAVLSEGQDANPVTVYQACQEKGADVAAGIFADLVDLYLFGGVYPSRLRSYVDCLARRRAEKIISESMQNARALVRYDGIGAAIGALQEAQDRATAYYRSPIVRLEDQTDAIMRPMEGVETGFIDIDNLLVCLPKGCLIVIAGFTGMGKTTWATDVGRYLAGEGKKVIKFDLEMSPVVNAQRIASARMGVKHTDILRGKLSGRNEKDIIAALGSVGIDFVYVPRLRPSNVGAVLKQAWTAYDLVIVDYLQLMTSDGRTENRNLEVAAMTRDLKALAVEFSVPVMVLSQLSRPAAREKSLPMPTLAMLRDSGAIEQDADMVGFVHRPEETKGVFRLAKNRIGPVGERELYFDAEHVTFKDLERRF